MVVLSSLWLPIVLSAVVVFMASFFVWMVLPHHRKDWTKLKDEDAVRKVLNDQGIGAGQYQMPYCKTAKEMADPEVKKRMDEGPVAILTVMPGPPNMGRNLSMTFTHYLVVSFLVAYVAAHTVPADAAYLAVFRVVGTVAVLSYCAGLIPAAIWFGRSWSSTAWELLDGIAYGLLTAGTFAWLWP